MKGKINFPFVNVRKEPNGDIKEVITGGSIVTIKGNEDGWYKTSKGYIREDLIDIIEEKKDGKL